MVKLTGKELFWQLKPAFYPKSIAVVGVSQNMLKPGSLWFKAIKDAGFEGNVYPVNPRGSEFQGLKIYSSIKEIPEIVDYVVVSIPRENIPYLLDDCAGRVKIVSFFTAGFSELGDIRGRKLEDEMVEKARRGGFRIIGPNCIGTYCPESKVPYGFGGRRKGKVGSVGFISQSGGIGEKLIEIGVARGINYNKGISFGNGIDLDSADFIKYMAIDPKISVIGVYLEGTQNGRRLFETMKEAARIKPLIVWKAGRTDIGAQAAMSHTGSLASSAIIWSTFLRQVGAIEVKSVEELADTMLIFQQLRGWQRRGNSIAIISGIASGGGGISVSASDTCAEHGLYIPPLTPETKQKLTKLLGQVGSIFRNPIDLSQSWDNPSTIREALDIVLSDPFIDLAIVQEDIGILLNYLSWETVQEINAAFGDIKTKYEKPTVIVLPPGINESARLKIERRLTQASMPVFPSMERAAKAIINLYKYPFGAREANGNRETKCL